MTFLVVMAVSLIDPVVFALCVACALIPNRWAGVTCAVAARALLAIVFGTTALHVVASSVGAGLLTLLAHLLFSRRKKATGST